MKEFVTIYPDKLDPVRTSHDLKTILVARNYVVLGKLSRFSTYAIELRAQENSSELIQGVADCLVRHYSSRFGDPGCSSIDVKHSLAYSGLKQDSKFKMWIEYRTSQTINDISAHNPETVADEGDEDLLSSAGRQLLFAKMIASSLLLCDEEDDDMDHTPLDRLARLAFLLLRDIILSFMKAKTNEKFLEFIDTHDIVNLNETLKVQWCGLQCFMELNKKFDQEDWKMSVLNLCPDADDLVVKLLLQETTKMESYAIRQFNHEVACLAIEVDTFTQSTVSKMAHFISYDKSQVKTPPNCITELY